MGKTEPGRLSLKLAALVTVVVVVAAAAYIAWTQWAQNAAVESKVLAEARTLNTEMSAVWDYIDESQQAINVNADGTYDFKGIYCSMAGKAIAQRFTRDSDGYGIRYVRENPRSATDVPDEFERAALRRFTEDGRQNTMRWPSRTANRCSATLRCSKSSGIAWSAMGILRALPMKRGFCAKAWIWATWPVR